MALRKVAVVMGSESDLETMQLAIDTLKKFDIPWEIAVLSAHRSPDAVTEFAQSIDRQGIDVVIAGAGKAAHLPGVLAAKTTAPVIGVPMETDLAGGLDSLLSIVQMPRGVPVATMGTGRSGAVNAAILAAQILARGDQGLRQKLLAFKKDMASKVGEISADVRRRLRLG